MVIISILYSLLSFFFSFFLSFFLSFFFFSFFLSMYHKEHVLGGYETGSPVALCMGSFGLVNICNSKPTNRHRRADCFSGLLHALGMDFQ